MRIIDLTQVADDAILDTHVLAIDDPSQTLKMTVAQLKEVIKAALNDVFVNVDGDIMTGPLTIKNDWESLWLKPVTLDNPVYIVFQNADDAIKGIVGQADPGAAELGIWNQISLAAIVAAKDGHVRAVPAVGRSFVVTADDSCVLMQNRVEGKAIYLQALKPDGIPRWYMGNGSNDYNHLNIINYEGGSNGITLAETGDIDIRTGNDGTQGAVNLYAPLVNIVNSTVTIKNTVYTVGEVGFTGLTNMHDKNGMLRWAYGPYQNGWYVYSYNPDGTWRAQPLFIEYETNNAHIAGQVIPQNYANFDARYQNVNTGAMASTGWHKDTNTGLITQWGKIAGGGAGVQVTFPIAFPTSANSATVTYHRGGAVDYSPSVPSLLPTGMTIDCDNAAGNLFWMVVGH